MKIKRIIEIESVEPVYDIEVATGDHTFMIGNTRVENCRLLSDTSKLSGFVNSIGGTALSIGSARVNTMNLVRIAYESKLNKKKYLSILADRTTLNCKVLYSIRHIIKRNIEKGLLPNYQDGAVELDKQYMTIGILGLYEVMDLFGLINTDELGNKSYSDEAIEFAEEIFKTINDIKDNFTDEFTFNVESIPGENCAGTICTADNLLFRDGSEDYSTTWYTFEYNGNKYKLNNKSTISVNVGNKKREIAFGEAIEKDYDIDENSLLKFKV